MLDLYLASQNAEIYGTPMSHDIDEIQEPDILCRTTTTGPRHCITI